MVGPSAGRPGDGDLTARGLVRLLEEYGDLNTVDRITEARPYLEAFVAAFGDRPVRGISHKDLHAFHKGLSAAPGGRSLQALVESRPERWESAYTLRAQGVVECLQWESGRPVKALVGLFDRPGFRPARVLELGCGNGVNAVFMAGMGCRVTAVDVSPTALRMARDKARLAGVDLDLIEGDAFEFARSGRCYDFVFDRGFFHHIPVVHFEDYKNLVAEALTPDGWFHLICHHVSTRPTVVLDCLAGFVGKLLGYLTGVLMETGAGFTADEITGIFADRFRVDPIDLIWDDNNRPLCFASAVMQRTS